MNCEFIHVIELGMPLTWRSISGIKLPKERRVDERTRVRHTLNYFLDVVDCNTDQKVGLMVDLSNRGLMVSSHHAMDIGAEYVFAVVDNRDEQAALQKAPFTVKSVWCKKTTEDGFDIGFEFIEVPPGAKSVFESYTAKQVSAKDRKAGLGSTLKQYSLS